MRASKTTQRCPVCGQFSSSWREGWTHTERAVTTSKDNAACATVEVATRAREWQEEAKRLCDQKFQEAGEAEAVHNDAIKCTVEKTEALEKLVKTVTMRADSLGTTEADFLQMLLERQEETQRDFNELQPCQTRTTQVLIVSQQEHGSHAHTP